MPSDAQESKGDAPGQFPTMNGARADKGSSSSDPNESIETVLDVVHEGLSIHLSSSGLQHKKPRP